MNIVHDLIKTQLQSRLPDGLIAECMQNMWGETVWSISATQTIPDGAGNLIFPDQAVFSSTNLVEVELFTRAAWIGAQVGRLSA